VSPGPFVSVIIPCLNEERFIGACLDSVLAGDYPLHDLEVLVVDGGSRDGTRAVVEEYARRHPAVRLLDNPRRITPAALNIGIRNARGQAIVRMDAHATVSPDYVRRCVEALQAHQVDNVGGAMVTLPRDPSPFAEAITAALSHPFGVGNSAFRTRVSAPRLVDTVFGGCYRREVFERIGYFNEELASSQDIELNTRLRRAGGRILLLPDVVSRYYTRSSFGSFVRNNFRNGAWAILPFAYTSVTPISWRHVVPLAFVVALGGGVVAAALWPRLAWLALGIAVAYGAAALVAAGDVARRGHRWWLLPVMPLVFGALHLAYGCGSLVGLAQVAALRLRRPPRG
jgi:glycosyltransferase involved in cell wall biosynthesis